MGKLQNVGTPRFYVDYIQWGLTTGLIKNNDPYFVSGLGDGIWSDGFGIGGSGGGTYIHKLFNQKVAVLEEIPKMFCLDPTKAYEVPSPNPDGDINLRQLTVNLHTNTGSTASWKNTWDINYAMLLNHNLHTASAKFGISSWILKLDEDEDGNDIIINEKEGLGNFSVVNEIVSDVEKFNGWSLIDITTTPQDANSIQLSLTYDDHTNLDQVPIRIGAISIGTHYDMPHSPDLNLSMDRDYGGFKRQITKGGSLLSSSNWIKPPMWSSGGAWELYASGGTERATQTRAGRRSWNLSFSYLSDSDLMADMETLTIYPNQSNGNPDSYENVLVDNSFFGKFMHKTLGGSLRFVFQPDNTDFNIDGFAICTLDQDSISIKQVANNTYNISLKIVEVW